MWNQLLFKKQLREGCLEKKARKLRELEATLQYWCGAANPFLFLSSCVTIILAFVSENTKRRKNN